MLMWERVNKKGNASYDHKVSTLNMMHSWAIQRCPLIFHLHPSISILMGIFINPLDLSIGLLTNVPNLKCSYNMDAL